MHYVIIIGIITVIVFYQLKIYNDTKNKLRIFRTIFSNDREEYKLSKEDKIEQINDASDDSIDEWLKNAQLDVSKYHYIRYTTEAGDIPCFKRAKAIKDLLDIYSNEPTQIVVQNNSNESFAKISNSINEYLSANKGAVSDFHLMKDIVDRNCDTKEEEINTQVPVPLYLGLVGTMGGILVGIGYLWISGGLTDLLNAGNGNSGADGVEALLGGVALAMISSILGILFTTFGSMKAKIAKAEVESNKHIFLSWIQAKLLPNLTNDTVQTLEKMSQNLTVFNNTFSDNTSNLGEALAKVNESYRLQTQLIDAVNKIQEGRTAATNLALLSKLIESSEQIGKLAEYLHNTNDYLNNVKTLNDKLDASEQRMAMLEGMGKFFKDEISQIDQRKEAISKIVGTVDAKLQEALDKLTDNTAVQIEEYKKMLGKQQDVLQQKLPEIDILVDELRKLSAIKDSISKFENAMHSQNSKLDNLVNAIHKLANAKTEGVSLLKNDFEPPRPLWQRILIWSISSIGGLLLLFLIIANWNSIYNGLINIFRI